MKIIDLKKYGNFGYYRNAIIGSNQKTNLNYEVDIDNFIDIFNS